MIAPRPLLSICVPTFNRLSMLRRNLEFHLRAFRELQVGFEIVVVDDRSDDGTAEYLATLSDAELSIYRRATNSGFLSNYAFAMRRAKGEYAIFLGDDDLLVPEQVMSYLSILRADERIGMIQAPWQLIDESRDGIEMGPFYSIPSETRFARGDYAAMTQFIFDFHVFPEFMIIRTDVLQTCISSPCPFVFWAFLYTARALARADIVFMPHPFARVTAIAADPRCQQGNRETMFRWDDYRGGLEYLVSLSHDPGQPLERRTATTDKINRFMMVREKVALRLLAHAGFWAECCNLYRRISAYEAPPLSADEIGRIGQLAGLNAAAMEAAAFGDGPVIVDPAISDEIVALIAPAQNSRLVRPDCSEGVEGGRAYLRLERTFPPGLAANDAVFDVSDYMAQFAMS